MPQQGTVAWSSVYILPSLNEYMYAHTALVAHSQASVQTLREQVRLLRSQRQRAVVLAHLPQLRPEAQPQLRGAPSKCAALEVVRRLQLEPAQIPKVADILHMHHTLSCCIGHTRLPQLLVKCCWALEQTVVYASTQPHLT